MPKVQTYGAPQVGPASTTQARFRAADYSRGALGAIGEGMQDLGKIAKEIGDQHAKTRADDLLLQADKRFKEIARGYKTKQNADALNARDATATELGKVYDEITTTKDPLVRQYLLPRLNQYRSLYDSDITDHAAVQEKNYGISVSKARVSNFAENAAANWDKPDLRRQFIEDGRGELKASLAAQGIADPEILKSEDRKYVSSIHTGIVDSFLVGGDIDGAESYLEANAGDIELGDELKLRSALKGPLERRQAAADFAGAVGQSVPVDGSNAGVGNPLSLDTMFSAIRGQESGGKQFGKDGKPLTSKAGAIGIMQVMPGTAPEAAKLAGLKWDESRYRNDAGYNKALGEAYFKEMLRQFKEPEIAAAAYNAGPGAVRNALKKGDGWLSALPKETQDYVGKFRKNTGGSQQSARRWDKESAYASIDAKADAEGWTFERRERAKDHADNEIARDEQLMTRRENEADRQASEVILGKRESFTDVSQIPTVVWSNMSASARSSAMNAAEANRKAKEPEANGPIMWQAHAIMYGDPDRFAKTDLSQYVGKVTRGEMDSLISEQAKLRSGGGKSPSVRTNISGALDFYSSLDKDLNKALDKKDNPEAFSRVFQDMEGFILSQTGGKREPTDAELKAAFSRATMRVMVPGKLWGTKDKYRFETEPGQRYQVEVPQAVRQRIIASYQRANGGVAPPDGMIGSIYVQHKGKPGFWN